MDAYSSYIVKCNIGEVDIIRLSVTGNTSALSGNQCHAITGAFGPNIVSRYTGLNPWLSSHAEVLLRLQKWSLKVEIASCGVNPKDGVAANI